MSWKKNWSRKLEGWVERRRHFRKIYVGTIGKLAGLRAPDLAPATAPGGASDPKRGEK